MDARICVVSSAIGTGLYYFLKDKSVDHSIKIFIALVVGQFLALKLYNMLIWPFFVSPLRHLPGPKGGTMFLGQAYNLSRALPGVLERSWSEEYPDVPFIRYLSIGNMEVLLVNSLKAHREVFQTKCYSFVKPEFFRRIVGEIAGTGILLLEGDEHKRQRKLLIAPFNFGNVKNLLPFFNVKAREMTAVVEDSIKENPSEPIEITEIIAKTTLDVIGLAALGYKLNALSTPSPLAESFQKIFDLTTPLQILIAVLHRYIPIRKWLPLKANQEYLAANAKVREVLREHMRRRRQDFKAGLFPDDKQSRDLLTLMIEESGDSYSEEEMLGYLLNFMSAGHETTGGAMTWAIYALTLQPELQTRLRKEITDAGFPESPSYSDLDNMKFLNNFVKEVLRFYPPALAMAREANEPLVIEDVVIPKGTLVIIAPVVPHFNKHIWGPTADAFDPDRFDDLPKAAQDPYAQQAFSSGPRICVGKSMALLEFKALLVEFVRNFEFANTGLIEPQKGGVSLRPLNGLRLHIWPVAKE